MMRMNWWMRRGLAALGLATLAGCAPTASAAPASSARPALWRVSDPDTSIYLLGTFHLLPQDYQWQTKAIQKAMAKSGSLYVETLIDEKNPQAAAAQLWSVAIADKLPPIANRISPALRPQLAEAIRQTGLPAAAFDRMKTWAVGFIIVQSQFKALGLSGEAGVEPALRRSFEASGKPIGQLETIGEQLSFFDTLSDAAQRAFLEGAITNPDQMRTEFAGMLQSWSVGDVAGIARTFNADLSDSPELRANLLTRRNRNWSQWIERKLAEPGTTMVAVGAGHLAGDESVIAMLQRDGYKVQRVE